MAENGVLAVDDSDQAALARRIRDQLLAVGIPQDET